MKKTFLLALVFFPTLVMAKEIECTPHWGGKVYVNETSDSATFTLINGRYDFTQPENKIIEVFKVPFTHKGKSNLVGYTRTMYGQDKGQAIWIFRKDDGRLAEVQVQLVSNVSWFTIFPENCRE